MWLFKKLAVRLQSCGCMLEVAIYKTSEGKSSMCIHNSMKVAQLHHFSFLYNNIIMYGFEFTLAFDSIYKRSNSAWVIILTIRVHVRTCFTFLCYKTQLWPAARRIWTGYVQKRRKAVSLLGGYFAMFSCWWRAFCINIHLSLLQRKGRARN